MAADSNHDETASEGDLDPDETVWVVRTRPGSQPQTYHTNQKCGRLTNVDAENIDRREARHATATRTHCKYCAGETESHTSHETSCALCGADDVLLVPHLRDDCPENQPDPDAGDATGGEATSRDSLRVSGRGRDDSGGGAGE